MKIFKLIFLFIFLTSFNFAQEGVYEWDSRFGQVEYMVGGIIRVVAADNNGNVYVGGGFETAGGITVNNIAMWDGNTWHALGSGVNGYVWEITVADNGDVYVGGQFSEAGGYSFYNNETSPRLSSDKNIVDVSLL